MFRIAAMQQSFALQKTGDGQGNHRPEQLNTARHTSDLQAFSRE
jgi:hypothetical protein